MSTISTRPLLAATVLLLGATLVGCGAASPTDPVGVDGGSSDDTGTDTGTDATADGGPSACVVGTWHADLGDLAEQLAGFLTNMGMPILAHGGDGEQVLTVDAAGGFRFDNDASLSIELQPSDVPMTKVTQNHRGSMSATWAWDDSASEPAMTFENVDESSYQVETMLEVEGTTIPAMTEVPGLAEVEGRLLVTCSGDSMSTKWEDGPFVTQWTRG